jgi:hypothetical protein
VRLVGRLFCQQIGAFEDELADRILAAAVLEHRALVRQQANIEQADDEVIEDVCLDRVDRVAVRLSVDRGELVGDALGSLGGGFRFCWP